MLRASLSLLTFLFLGLTNPATAAANRDASSSDRMQCSSAKPEVAIIACTQVIQDKHEDDDIRAAALRNRASFYAQQGDFSHAIIDYTAALNHPEPRRVQANLYLNRGLMYFRQADLDRALADYGEAVTLDPTLATAYINRSAILIARGDNDRAIADLGRVIALNPKDSAVYVTPARPSPIAAAKIPQSPTTQKPLN